jgi:hypothetical protein
VVIGKTYFTNGTKNVKTFLPEISNVITATIRDKVKNLTRLILRRNIEL